MPIWDLVFTDGSKFRIERLPLIIGRNPDCDLTLPDKSTSRQHARIESLAAISSDLADSGKTAPSGIIGLRVVDLKSSNGIYLNQVRIKDEAVIRPGDQLRIGATELLLSLAASESSEADFSFPFPADEKIDNADSGHDQKLYSNQQPLQQYSPPPAPPVSPIYAPAVSEPSSPRKSWFGMSFLLLILAGIGYMGWNNSHLLNLSGEVVLAHAMVGPASAAQIVNWENRVAVVIPAGALSASATLTIIAATDRHPSPKGMEIAASATIHLSGTLPATSPILLRFRLDPAILAKLGNEPAVIGACWDEKIQAWAPAPTVIDKKNGEAIIRTRHLSVWRVYYLGKGYRILDTANFRIVHDDRFDTIVGKKSYSAVEAAQTIGNVLEHAWRNYAAAGFRMPNKSWYPDSLLHQIVTSGISLDLTPAKIWVFANCSDWGITSDKWDEVSQRRGLSGAIFLAGSFADLDELRGDTAHELFHAVQVEYWNIFLQGLFTWFIESTADYGAERVAWQGTIQYMGAGMGPAWFRTPIWRNGGQHNYQTAHFLAHIISTSNGLSFRELWESTRNTESGGTNLTNNLNSFLRRRTGRDLSDFFRVFAFRCLIQGKVPGNASSEAKKSSGEPQQVLGLKQDSIGPVTMRTASGLTLATDSCRIEVDSQKRSRRVRLEITGSSSDDMVLDVVLIRPDSKNAPIPLALEGAGASATFEIRPRDRLHFLATNRALSDTAGELAWQIVDETISIDLKAKIDPDDAKHVWFLAKVIGVPASVKKLGVSWEMDERGESVVIPQEVKQNGKPILIPREEKFPTQTNHTAVIRLYDVTSSQREKLVEAKVEVKPALAEIQPRVQTVSAGKAAAWIVKGWNLPKGVTYKWDLGDKSKSVQTNSSEHKHVYQKPGEMAVTVSILAPGKNEVLAKATGRVKVEGEPVPEPTKPSSNAESQQLLALIKRCNNAHGSASSGCREYSYNRETRHSAGISVKVDNLVWSGQSFTGKGSSKSPFNGDFFAGEENCSVSGRVSDDGKMLLEVKYEEEIIHDEYFNAGGTDPDTGKDKKFHGFRTVSRAMFSAKNIPLGYGAKNAGKDIIKGYNEHKKVLASYDLSGTELYPNVTAFSYDAGTTSVKDNKPYGPSEHLTLADLKKPVDPVDISFGLIMQDFK